MATGNLVLRFVVEVLGLMALGYAGLQASDDTIVSVLACVAAVAAFIVIWALVVAPRARNGLAQPQRDLIGTVLLLLAAVALARAGQPGVAIAFAVLVIVNSGLSFMLGHDARAIDHPSR